jgi:hypothetical protein
MHHDFSENSEVPISHYPFQHLRSGQHWNTTLTGLEMLRLETHKLAFVFSVVMFSFLQVWKLQLQ